MARVDIPGIGMQTFPDSMSDKEILAQANILREKATQKVTQKAQNPLGLDLTYDPRDLSLGQKIKGGFSRGLEGLKGTALDLVPALGASIIGKDDYAKQQLKEYQDRMAAEEQINPTAYKSYKEIGGAGDLLGFGAETLGELGPDILSFFTGIGAAASVGKYAATKGAQKLLEKKALNYAAEKGLTGEAAKQAAERYTKQAIGMDVHANIIKNAAANGANIGQKFGLFGTAGGLGIPETFNRIYEDTGNLEPGIALTMGSLKSALDTYLPSKLLKQLGPAGKDRIAAAMLDKSNLVPITFKRAFAGEALKTTAGEGLTEGTQEVIDLLASQIAGNKDPFFSQKNIDSIITAALKGTIGGGVIGTPGAVVEAGRIKSARANEIARQEEEALKAQAQPPVSPELSPRELASLQRQERQQGAVQQMRGDLFADQFMSTRGVGVSPLTVAEKEQAEIEAALQSTSQAPAIQPGQMGLDLEGGMTAEDIAAQQIEAQRVEQNQAMMAQVQAQQEETARRAAEAKAQLDQAIADTDARVQNGELNRRQAARLELLHPVLENTTIANTAAAFQGNLKRAGYASLELTEYEKDLIQKADNVKTALAESELVQPIVQEASLPNQLTPEITGIKERGEKGPAGTPQPKQLNLFGQQRFEPVVPEEVVPESTINTVLDADTLSSTGLPKQSPFFKQLMGKDMANPADQAAIAEVLAKVRANRLISESTKDAIERIANQGFAALATQQEMFDNRGRIKKGTPNGRVQPRTVDTTSGTSTAVPIEPTATESAEGITALEGRGVVPTAQSVDQSGVGEEVQSSALTQEEQDDIQQELQAELASEEIAKPTTKTAATEKLAAVAVPKAAKDALKQAEKEKARREKEEGSPEFQELAGPSETPFDVSKGYLGFAKEDIQNIDDNIIVTELLRTPTMKPIAKAAKTYFGKMPRMVDNLINIAYDLTFDTPQFRVEGESNAESNFFQGMNGKNARLATDWVHENLSAETDKQFRSFIRGFEVARDNTSNAELMDLIRSGLTGTKEATVDATIQDYINAMAEEKASKNKKILNDAVVKMAMPLHPSIIASLQAGDLQTALNLLAASSDRFISGMASNFAKVNLGTNVELRDNLVDESGRSIPGFFDPKTNTIYLDSNTGMNSHVLLHETGHAATSHELDNPNSVLARQLQQLLDDTKDSLTTAYGSTDVHEFASEALSNPSFRAQLRSINPNGGTITAWDKFVRAVTNFFRRMVGMPSKPLSSALDEADRIILSIISAGPSNRNAGVLYAPAVNKGEQLYSFTDRLINAIPIMGENQKNALSAGIAGGINSVKSAIFSLLPMHALSDIAEPVFPGLAKKFNQLIDERAGYENRLNRGADTIVNQAKEAIKLHPADRDPYNKIVNESTVNEVDPSRQENRDKYTDPDALKEFDRLRKEYLKLSPIWQDLYVKMRNAYKQMYEEIKKSIESRIDGTNLDNDTKLLVKKDIMAKLSEKGVIDPYFALGREGQYWLGFDYVDKAGQAQRGTEAFKSPRERATRMQELNSQGATGVEAYSNISEINYRRAPANSFVSSVLQIMEANKVDPKAVDEMMRLFISTLPETAFAQSFQKRKGTAGYMEDTIGVFERKMRNTAHQVANMAYNPKLSGVIDTMQERTIAAGKSGQGNELEKQYLGEFEKHLKYVLNPTNNDIGSILTSAAFTYTLGFNISSAIVNMANVPMIVAPYLKGQYAGSNVAGAIGNASKVFLGSGTKAQMPVLGADGETRMMNVMPSMANLAPDSPLGMKYASLIKLADDRGQLNRSQLYEIINGDTRTGYLAKFNAMSGWMFHHGERMNREVTMMATYDLEMQKLANDISKGKITQEAAELQAADKAIYVAELTNGGISAASAPRIAQNPLGKVLFMYKRYGVSMYYMMFKTYKEAINQNLSPEERKAAWKQLGGIVGMSAIMAGAQGIPLFGLASMVYALFSDEDDDDLDTATRKYLGEFAYKGPIEYMTNLSIAGRITLNDLIVRDTKGGSSASTFSQQVIQAMGGPVLGVGDRIARGLSKIAEGNFQRGVEDILPSFLGNPLKGYRYATEGTQTLRGDPITGDVSAWNIGAQAFGFAPADYTRQLEINAQLKGVDKYVNERATKLKQKYYLANRVGDIEGREEFKQDLLDLGDKHPGLGINAGTISSVINRSMKAQERATKEMVNGVRYSKRMLKELQADAAEYE
jgi:hypothetical protein